MIDPAFPPAELDEYRLVRVLGRGAMGTVWLAHDENLDRAVAIKLISAADPDPETRERFVLEARALARLHHPNVVTVHRVGSAGGRPYLVSEYVRGKTLAELPRPVEIELATRLAVGLARGLAAAHRAGVLHRDVKPANALLGDDGEVKLVDFGLARLLDKDEPHDGSLLGTPAYMAPELWRGEPATARSDVYALGATLFSLLAGRPPHEAATPEALSWKVANERPPPLRTLRAEAPELLADVVDSCLRADPEERPATGEALREALERLLRRRVVVGRAGDNPYRGLFGFHSEHRDLFFGRDMETGDLLERMRGEAWVVVAGRSGTGKSSLVRAGLLPRILEGALRERASDPAEWRVASVLPGATPHAALLAACAPLCGKGESELAADPTALARELRADRGRATVIFIDQMEELVTLAGAEERDRFVEALRPLLSLSPSLRVVATVRSDFVGHFEALGSLHREFARALYVLGPMTPEGLRDAVVAPAEAQGYRFESDALIDSLAAPVAADQGSLPLLSFALAKLWDERDQKRKLLSAEALERIGGVEGALARHADDVLAALPPAGRACAHRLLVRLVTANRTRARRTMDELAGDDADLARETLEALVRGRLLSTGEVDGRPVFEVAHEALIAGWQRLRLWLDEEREEHRLLERVELAAAEWDRHGRAVDLLWRGRLVDDLSLLPAASLPPVAARFSEASRRAEERARWRRRLALVAVPTLVFGTIFGVQTWNQKRLEARADASVARARMFLQAARADNGMVDELRRRMFQLYDERQIDAGTLLWAMVRTLTTAANQTYDVAQGPINEALGTVAGYMPARRVAADVSGDRFLIAERDDSRESLQTYGRQLAFYDADRFRALSQASASLAVDTVPGGARVDLYRFVDRDGRYEQEAAGTLGLTPLPPVRLSMGSYLLLLTREGFETTRYPVLLRRGANDSIRVPLLEPHKIQRGFVFVPGGTTVIGTRNEAYVTQQGLTPEHDVFVDSFFIARNETTLDELREYVAATPSVRDRFLRGRYRLFHENAGVLELDLFVFGLSRFLRPGELYRYSNIERGNSQDSNWLRWPATFVTAPEAESYVRFLANTGRVPRARLCREIEWERAARGADGRTYPHGESLRPRDASIGSTYGEAYRRERGPDEVGLFPASRSVFGVDDLVGSVWEWTSDQLAGGERMMKSGSWENARGFEAEYRETAGPSYQRIVTGLRVCADVE